MILMTHDTHQFLLYQLKNSCNFSFSLFCQMGIYNHEPQQTSLLKEQELQNVTPRHLNLFNTDPESEN